MKTRLCSVRLQIRPAISLSRLLVGVAAVLLALPSYSQVNVGRISGTVADQTGAAMPGITVTIEDSSTRTKVETLSQANGDYVFPSLPPGNYTLSVEKAGFARIRQTDIILDAASSRTINLVMTVGEVTQSVEVTATAQQVTTDSGSVAETLDNRKIDQIAMNGRNYYNLLNFLPGVTTSSLDPTSVGVNLTGTFINGSRNPSTGIYLDGTSNVAIDQNSYQNVVPNPDTIAEIKVLSSSYDAEVGGASGATITMVTKSGTNQLHGSLFEYLRNNAFDARSFLAPTKEPLHLNDFGGTIGGPVYIPKLIDGRNKLFFFGGVEQKYYHYDSNSAAAGATVSISVVPTVLERQGVFQGSGLPAPIDPTNGAPFPNQIVPQNRWSQNGPALLNIYPLPNYNSPAGNFERIPLSASEPLNYQMKLDFNPTEATRYSSSFVMNADHTWNNGGALGITHSVRGAGQPGWVWGTNMTHSFSPSLINYLSFGVSQQNFSYEPPVPSLNRNLYGITFPGLSPINPYNEIPKITMSGFTGISYAFPSKEDITFTLRDDISKVLRGHLLKFGAQVMRARDNEPTTGFWNDGGTVTFAPSGANSAGNVIANALLGNFYQFTEDKYGPFGWFRFSTFEAYAQDNWTVNKHFHLNYGVRYSLDGLPYSPIGNDPVFFPSLYQPSQAVSINASNGAIVSGSGNLYNGIALPGSGWSAYPYRNRIPNVIDLNQYNSLFVGLPKSIWNSRKNDFAPRLGVAYDPVGDGKTAIRAGFGIFYDRPAANIYLLQMSNNPPVNGTYTVYNGNIDNPAGANNATYPSALQTVGLVFKTPYTMTYNLTVQRQLPGHIILDVGYVGTQGRHLAMGLNENQLPVGTLYLPQNKGVNANALEPYLGYGSITEYSYTDNSNYNALQASANRRMASGLSFGSAFTWSKALDDLPAQTGFTPTTVQNSYNAKADYGPSTASRKFVFSVNVQYELPFARHSHSAMRAVAGGWVVSTVFFAQSGAPQSVTVSSDVAGIGVASSRASLIPGQSLQPSVRTPAHWFNTAAFLPVSQMPLGQFGNSGRDILIGPGYQELDLSLFKHFTIKERADLEFRAESFNLPNHASFTTLGTVVGTSTFGAVTATGNPRIDQFALKLHF